MLDDCEWYDAEDDDNLSEHEKESLDTARADSLIAETMELEEKQKDWHISAARFSRHYYNRDLVEFDWGLGTRQPALAPIDHITQNLVLSIGETMVSVIGKNRPKPTPVTTGGSWVQMRNAEMMGKAVYAEFVRNNVYALTQQCFKDSFVTGIGALLVGFDSSAKRLTYTRVFPDNIIVDHDECSYDENPVTFRIRRVVSKAWVEETYDVDLDEKGGSYHTSYRGSSDDRVVIVQAWRRPYAGKPGRMVVATAGKLLEDKPWDEDWFPVVVHHYEKPGSGFYGRSGVEGILPYQSRLNKINAVIREAQDLVLRPRLVAHRSARVQFSAMDNVPTKALLWDGNVEPKMVVWPAISPELYNERLQCVEDAYNFAGVSQLSANQKLPGGARLDSSKALQEYNFKEEDRHAPKAQSFEDFHVRIADITIRMLRKYKKQTKIRPFVGGDYLAEVIDWQSIDLDADYYVFSIQPTSVFSMSPAARIDTLSTWMDKGIIAPDEFMMYSGNPDLERLMAPKLAATKDIEETIVMLQTAENEEDFVGPDGFQNLQMGLDMVHKTLLRIRRLPDVPGWVLNNFTRWLGLAQAIVDQAAGADAAMEASLAAMPQAPPGAQEEASMGAQIDPEVMAQLAAKAPTTNIYKGDYIDAGNAGGITPAGVMGPEINL